jgi:hypothetical protein
MVLAQCLQLARDYGLVPGLLTGMQVKESFQAAAHTPAFAPGSSTVPSVASPPSLAAPAAPAAAAPTERSPVGSTGAPGMSFTGGACNQASE